MTEAWRKLAVLLDRDDESVDFLTQVAELALVVIRQHGSTISMAGLRCDSVRPMPLATVLRATYALRETIEGWDEALELARRLLVARGDDPADALYGLI